MDLFDKACVVSGDGSKIMPAEGAVLAVNESGKVSYYDLSGVIDTVVTSCGRFMLDQSLLDEPPEAVKAALNASS